MRIIQLLAALPSGFVTAQAISNPFESGSLFVSPLYTEKLEETYDALVAQGNTESAAVVRAAQMWARLSGLPTSPTYPTSTGPSAKRARSRSPQASSR